MNQMKYDQVRQAFAARFREALAAMGYSINQQKAMRQLFGVSPQAVRKWAEGQSLPSATRMPEVASVLGVRRAWLQDGEGPINVSKAYVKESKSEYGTTDALPITGKELELLQLYRQLSLQQRKLIQQLMKQLSQQA